MEERNMEATENLFAAGNMPEDALVEIFASISPDEEKTRHFKNAMKMLGIDIEAITEGWEEKERLLFSNVVRMWTTSLHDRADAYIDDCIFVLMMKHFLIPTLEKKKALEKMLTLIGKEEN